MNTTINQTPETDEEQGPWKRSFTWIPDDEDRGGRDGGNVKE